MYCKYRLPFLVLPPASLCPVGSYIRDEIRVLDPPSNKLFSIIAKLVRIKRLLVPFLFVVGVAVDLLRVPSPGIDLKVSARPPIFPKSLADYLASNLLCSRHQPQKTALYFRKRMGTSYRGKREPLAACIARHNLQTPEVLGVPSQYRRCVVGGPVPVVIRVVGSLELEIVGDMYAFLGGFGKASNRPDCVCYDVKVRDHTPTAMSTGYPRSLTILEV